MTDMVDINELMAQKLHDATFQTPILVLSAHISVSISISINEGAAEGVVPRVAPSSVARPDLVLLVVDTCHRKCSRKHVGGQAGDPPLDALKR